MCNNSLPFLPLIKTEKVREINYSSLQKRQIRYTLTGDFWRSVLLALTNDIK